MLERQGRRLKPVPSPLWPVSLSGDNSVPHLTRTVTERKCGVSVRQALRDGWPFLPLTPHWCGDSHPVKVSAVAGLGQRSLSPVEDG